MLHVFPVATVVRTVGIQYKYSYSTRTVPVELQSTTLQYDLYVYVLYCMSTGRRKIPVCVPALVMLVNSIRSIATEFCTEYSTVLEYRVV